MAYINGKEILFKSAFTTSCEIVQETGDSDSAVMSQKAVTDELKDLYKVPASTTNYFMLGIDNKRNPILKQFTQTATSGAMVMRKSDANIPLPNIAPAEGSYDAISRKAVEDLIAAASIGGGGSGGTAALYRHNVCMEIYNSDMTCQVDTITFAFSYVSSSTAPFPTTMEGIFEFLAANGFTACSGTARVNGTVENLYGLNAWDGGDGWRYIEVYTENHCGDASMCDHADEPNFSIANISVIGNDTTAV